MKWYKKLLCKIGLHDWKLINTERCEVRLFKKLYKANDWNTSYKIETYECNRCGERDRIHNA